MRKLTAVQIKDIPLSELVRILEIRAADFDVLIGIRGKVCLTSGVESVCLNGAIVQINLTTAALDDVMEDGAFRWAFNDTDEAPWSGPKAGSAMGRLMLKSLHDKEETEK